MYEDFEACLLDSNICRVCLVETDQLRSLYKLEKICGETTKLAIMVRECTSIEMCENDGLPGQMCNKCVIQISNAYVFKLQCKNSDQILREKLQSIENSDIDEIAKIFEENLPANYTIDEYETTEYNLAVNHPNQEAIEKMDDDYEIHRVATPTKEVFHKVVVRSQSQINSVKCGTCGKMLSNPNSLKRHMQVHAYKTQYLCDQCGEGFKRKTEYRWHMIRHNANIVYKCNFCKKAYCYSTSLKRHMKTHAGEKPFLCGICGKEMTEESGFSKHMLVHTSKKKYECDICRKDFHSPSYLIIHKRRHTVETPFACKFCDKKFGRLDALQVRKESLLFI